MCARLNSVTNATTSCKILVKIGPVVLAEKILIEIALCFHDVVRRISSNISGSTGPNFAIFSPFMKALYVPMMDLYFIFQFVKGRCHGNQFSGKMRQNCLPHLHLSLCHSETVWDNAVYVQD